MKKRIRIILVALIIIGAIVPSIFVHFKWGKNYWDGWLDQYSALGTIVFAIIIWISETRRDKRIIEKEKEVAARDKLPKKLNVVYEYKQESGQIDRWYFNNSPLVSEADIRNWGQSIGRLMNKWGNIQLAGFKMKPKEYLFDRTLYTIVIYLDEELPIPKETQFAFNDDGRLIK